MKQRVFIFALLLLLAGKTWSQCVQNCSGYTVSPITYSLFPTAGNNVTSAFIPNNDDGYTTPVPLGFSFNYYCTTYTSVLICSNGFLVFNSSTPPIAGSDPAQTLPNSTNPNGIIALNMNDFDPSFGGTVTFTTIGTSPNQMFIVTYSDVPIWYNSATNTPSVPVYNTGQIVLYETSNQIEIHSAGIGQSPYSMTQGIEDQSGTSGLAAPGRNNTFWSTTNTAYLWEKTLIGASPTGISGNTLICFGDTATYAVNSMSGAVNYSWSLPTGWQGSSTTNTVGTVAGLPGSLSVTASYSACGVSSPAIITVSVMPPPVINVTGVSPPIICSGGVAVVNLSGGVSYTINPGGITGSPPLNFTVATNTTYSVTGSSVDGCVNVSPVTIPLAVNATPTVSVNSGTICLGESFTLSPTGANNYTFSSLFSVVTPSTTGINQYLIVGANNNGCSSTAVSTVIVNPLPVIGAVSSRTAICINEVATFTAQGGGTYLWAHNNSTAAVQSVTPGVTASYTVTGSSLAGCKRDAVVTISVNFCTSIHESEADLSLVRLFPNPGSGRFNLTLTSNATLFIYDMNGKKMFQEELTEGNNIIDLSGQPNGIYFVKCLKGRMEKNMTLIKE